MINKLLEAVKSKRKVLIQTHNNPDPDTIAAAFALKNLLTTTLKKRVTIAYMGVIGRAENKEFVKTLYLQYFILMYQIACHTKNQFCNYCQYLFEYIQC